MADPRQYYTLFVIVVSLILGCEEPFTPKGEFREEPVVYVILSNLSDTHYARIYRTYNPPAFDPFEQKTDNPIVGALVTLSEPTIGQAVFRDTVIARADSSRYTTPIEAYVCSPLQLRRGKRYTLQVQPPGGPTLTEDALVPELGYISIYKNQPAVTGQSVIEPSIGIRVTVPTTTRGYLVRFHVTFEALQNAVWVPHEIEIPYFVNNPGLPEERYEYYGVTRSIETEGTFGTVVTHTADFDILSYGLVISRLYKQYGGTGSVRFKQAVFTLTQVEKQLYNYYNISRGFRDPNSIRVDEPDYTNITGGGGVFGAFSVDSIVVNLPATI